MAGKPEGNLLSPSTGENEENREPLGLAMENAEETSDVSASLFKEISSEEELEVLSGSPHRQRVDGGILGLNTEGNAESEAETSGEDGSLFGEIAGDDSHFGGLGNVQQSAYGTAANGDNGAGYILGGSIRFQTEDVPFIRSSRGDLDGPLDGPLAALRREDGASLHTFEEKLSSIFEDIRAKEESSTIAGICRDYGSSSGENGGDDGVDAILADPIKDGALESLPVNGQDHHLEHVEGIVELLMIPMAQAADVKIVSQITELTPGNQPEASILPLTVEGDAPTGELVDGVLVPTPKKRGRASRELGALLMEAKGNGRRRKPAGLQADVSDSFALAVVRGTTEAGASVDGVVFETPEGVASRVEVRVTRSRASGRLAPKKENLDISPDSTGSPDVAAKRTGKRSAARGGRLGWGNGLETSADGSLLAEEGLLLPDAIPGEAEIQAVLEGEQPEQDLAKETGEGSGSKSGGRARKARGKGKQGSSPAGGNGSGSNSHLDEPHTEGITTDITGDFNGLKPQSQIDEVLITPPSAGTVPNSEPLETEAVDPSIASEPNSGGRRRSTRQKGKVGMQPEAGQLPGQQRKRKQQRKGAAIAKNLPQVPSGSQQLNDQAVGSTEDAATQLNPSEQNQRQIVGDDVEGGEDLVALEQVPANGRKTLQPKSTNKGSPKSKKINGAVSETLLEEASSGELGSEAFPSGIITTGELSLENGTSRGDAAGLMKESDIAQKIEPMRPEKIGEESSLDVSGSEIKRPLTEEGEGLANPSGEVEDNIPPVEFSLPANVANCSLLLDTEAGTHSKTKEGGSELKTLETVPENLEAFTLPPSGDLVTVPEKLEAFTLPPPGDPVTVPEPNGNVELRVKSSLPTEPVAVFAVKNCEAGGTAGMALESERCPTVVNETSDIKPSVGMDNPVPTTDPVGITRTEAGAEQPALPELSFAEPTPSNRVDCVVGVDHTGADVKPHHTGADAKPDHTGVDAKPDHTGADAKPDHTGADVKPADVTTVGKGRGGGKGRVGVTRKGGSAKKQKVDAMAGPEADTKPKSRARKKAPPKTNPADEAGSLPAGEHSVTEAKKKTSTASRKGKRKFGSENATGSVTPTQDASTVDGLGPSQDAVVNDTKDPIEDNKTVKDKPDKVVKSRKKAGNPTAAVEGGVPKKRRKTEKKVEGPPSNNDPASVPTTDNAGGKEQEQEPAGSVAAGSGSQVKASPSGKSGGKKSQTASSGKKVAKTSPGGSKIKQAKKPPRASAKAKGVGVKVLPSVKEQSSDKKPLGTKNRPAHLKIRKADSKPTADVTDPCAPSGEQTGRLETAAVAVESSAVNPETNGNVAKKLQSEEAVRDLDSGAVGEDVSSGVTEGGENKGGSEKGIDSAAGAETGAARKSWVLCDDCNKWRCIPVELADQIESTNARWTCRENPDKAFQECSVPQEKSNAEINAELQISEVSVCEEGDDKDAVDSKSFNLGGLNEDNKPAVWKRIRRNIFQHRRRKVLEIDEMMVCQCTPPEDGGVGCGENCLNRMLSIECVAEQCPCGEACSNQQFQSRTYAPISMYRCGKKGFGLRLVDGISKGTFIIEYVGEVLDVGAFEARQQEYARKGQKHFYFMTLNTNEVIDACSKGNYGRFINHSCEPNCRTEKWMVNGEVCIGLFAVRDIAKDEEVTFDYNYVRVCGAAAKKCECGSAQCRGFIGGDPLTPKAVVESDSEDDEDLEPIMVENSEDEDAYVDENKPAPCKKPRAEAEFQETSSVRTIGIKRKSNVLKEKSVVKRFKSSSHSRRSSSSLNFKGLTVDVSAGRHESPRPMYFSDVQDKLDDMLDRNGGLRKRRDAAKQYLKLLVLTSASGDSRKDATACSVRDLSLLLEALLKTTSRTVLSDIMNKNGLRMLHNLIKQLRRQWDKTPILRKLLKVLELLASERLLTTDLINSGPPCSGMESFSESLFELTRHKDTEVVHMVRRFRNRWMPPGIWDRHYLHLQSSSPAVMHHSEQLSNMGSRFQSPQHHLKQQQSGALPQQSHAGSSDVSRPGSSQGAGSLPASQSHNALASMDGAAPSKDDVKSFTTPSDANENTTLGATQPGEKPKRKRPSRWDAPARIPKTPKAPSDQPDTQNPNLRHQTPTLPAVHTSQGPGPGPSAGQQALHQTPVTPAPQPGWPFSPSGVFQGSARPPNDGMSGQPQQMLHPQAHLVQNMPPTQHMPAGAAPPMMPMGLPPPPPMPPPGPPPPSANVGQFGPPPLPTRGFPRGPPMQMANTGLPIAQVMHGSAVPQTGMGYPGEPRPPPMPPTAPYGQWRPPPSAPNFPGAHSYPMDPSQVPQMQSQSAPWPQPLQRVEADGAQRLASSQDASLVKRKGAADVEIEPPVPGLGEPPVPGLSPAPQPPAPQPAAPQPAAPQPPAPQPPAEPVAPVVWGVSDSQQGYREMHEMAERDQYYQAQWMPPPQYVQGQVQLQVQPQGQVQAQPQGHAQAQGQVQGQGEGMSHDYYGTRDTARDSYRGDGPWVGYPCGEYWDSPEGAGFRADVFSMVSTRVHKHHKLRTKDLDRFCSKLADVIVRKEVAKYLEHRNQGVEKIIVKTKLIEKVDSYVDSQVGQYLRKIDKSHRGG